jgi:capsular polysaccharide biosynthesis protein
MSTAPDLEDDKVSLRHYKQLILSLPLWIIPVSVVIGMVVAYLITKQIAPTYMATTTIMVSKANLDQTSNYDTVLIGENLARTYAEMITGGSVLDQVRTRLALDVSSRELEATISVNHHINTQLIEISVENSDPGLAVKIANSLVEIFSDQIRAAQLESVIYQEGALKTQLQDAENEINRLQEKIKAQSLQLHNQRLKTVDTTIGDIRNQIEQLNQEVTSLQSKGVLTESEKLELSNKELRKQELFSLLLKYQDRLVALNVSGPTLDPQDLISSQDAAFLDQNQRVYYNLLQSYQDLNTTVLQNGIIVTQVDQPVLPESPIRPNTMINVILGFIAGLLLSLVYIFIAKLGGR